MDEISLEQLEEMQKDLFKKQCDLDIREAMLKHFIKKERAKQLILSGVSDSLPKISDCCKADADPLYVCSKCDNWCVGNER